MSVKDYLKLRLDASREIKDVKFETDTILLVTHTPRVETIRANKFSAVHHAVYVGSTSLELLLMLQC